MSHSTDPVERRPPAILNMDLSARRRTLEDRLDEGYQRIDQAVLSGADVTEWESFWLRLLGEYEDLCRDLERAA